VRNSGYEITDKDIKEGMNGGSKLAAHSVGIAASIVNRITPMYQKCGEISFLERLYITFRQD
jgi:hypothetical protein